MRNIYADIPYEKKCQCTLDDMVGDTNNDIWQQSILITTKCWQNANQFPKFASLWSLSYCLRRWFAILFSPNTNYVDIYYQKRAIEKNGYFCLERPDSWIMVFRSWTLRYAAFSPMILQLPPVWKPYIPMTKTHTHQNLEQVSSQIKKFFVIKWAKIKWFIVGTVWHIKSKN